AGDDRRVAQVGNEKDVPNHEPNSRGEDESIKPAIGIALTHAVAVEADPAQDEEHVGDHEDGIRWRREWIVRPSDHSVRKPNDRADEADRASCTEVGEGVTCLGWETTCPSPDDDERYDKERNRDQ